MWVRTTAARWGGGRSWIGGPDVELAHQRMVGQIEHVDDRCRYVLRAKNSSGVGLEQRLIVNQSGVHRSRADGDGPDVVLADFEHEGLAEPEDRMFGRGVGGPAHEPVAAGEARDIGDGAA